MSSELKTTSIRLSEQQRKTLKEQGGGKWLREKLDELQKITKNK